jgi:hypothetical protein
MLTQDRQKVPASLPHDRLRPWSKVGSLGQILGQELA